MSIFTVPPNFLLKTSIITTAMTEKARVFSWGSWQWSADGWDSCMARWGEAAFLIGMERNQDVVELASYAPLLENVNYNAWFPNLISF